MTSSLERLNEIVRQAEARSRSKKVEAELRQAADRLREAEYQARGATRRLREERPTLVRNLKQAEIEEGQLRDLVRKLAQFKSALDPGSDPEGLIDDAQVEIENLRSTSLARLETLKNEADEARKILRAAMDHYLAPRRELDRLLPRAAEFYAAEDRILWDAETHFPGGMLHALAREVDQGAPHFGSLSRPEQYAQLKAWIGRYRHFQDDGDPEIDPSSPLTAEYAAELHNLAQRVFNILKNLSKQHEPGYIDAFRLDFAADWPAYVAEAEAQLQLALDPARAPRARSSPQLDAG